MQDVAEHVKARLINVCGQSLGRVVLDAGAIPFVDSRGLEVLVEVTEELGQGGRALKLCRR